MENQIPSWYPGIFRKFSPKYGSAKTPFLHSAARTVEGTVVSYHPIGLNVPVDKMLPFSLTLSDDCIVHPLFRGNLLEAAAQLQDAAATISVTINDSGIFFIASPE